VIQSLANANLIRNDMSDQDYPGMHEHHQYQYHIRLGHQSYTAIDELAARPESGIKLTDHEKPHCLACDEGK
jgi:hypothetical protein